MLSGIFVSILLVELWIHAKTFARGKGSSLEGGPGINFWREVFYHKKEGSPDGLRSFLAYFEECHDPLTQGQLRGLRKVILNGERALDR